MTALTQTGTVGARRVLFRTVMNDLGGESFAPFGVSPDGQRFLVNTPSAPEPVTLLQLPRRGAR